MVVRVLTVTADPSEGSDLALLPTQKILAADSNLLDHRLILSIFSHDSKIDPKVAKTESVKEES